jgi:hypothetical protein
MKTWILGSGVALGAPILVTSSIVGACGASDHSGFTIAPSPDAGAEQASSGSNGTSPDAGGQAGPIPVFTDDSGSGSMGTSSSTCPSGVTTSISGKVYDPAGNNPLYNVAVYVPAAPLQPLPKGVPTGADACSCGALFQSGAITNTTTAVDGTFHLANVPVGTSVPLVLQIGKWRRQIKVDVKGCQDNPQPDKSLAFLGTLAPGDTTDSIPDIAVSTGGADTLECLLLRVGLSASEYVPGSAGGGHIHVFSGGMPISGSSTNGTGSGGAESPAMAGAPTSWTKLWDTQTDLMPYDILLLSCEGGETYNSNPIVLEQYLNAGGRAFASHYHYAWFAGSLGGDTSVPPPPVDWGSNLDEWNSSGTLPQTNGYAEVVQTLNGSTSAFAKGQALAQWLQIVGALGIEGAPAGQIPISDETQNAGATNKAQPWLTDNGTTDYLSFDTPVDAPAPPDGGAPNYCGRAVFAGVHVDADQSAASAGDKGPPPTGCVPGALSPQEKALEFMLFDLSSCVLPDTVPPPVDAGLPPPPK